MTNTTAAVAPASTGSAFSNMFSSIASKVENVFNAVVKDGEAALEFLETEEQIIAKGAANIATSVDGILTQIQADVALIPELENAVTIGKAIFDNLIGIVEALSGGPQAPGGETKV